MSKMQYLGNTFSKIAKRWGLFSPSAHYSFNFGDLEFRDLAKLCFFKLIMTKSNFKK